MTYTISRDQNAIHVVAAGVVTLEDCIRSVDALLAKGELRPGMKLVVDITTLKPELSFSDLRDLVRQVERLVRGGLLGIAIVADTDLVYGLARTFSTYAELQGLNVVAAFRNREQLQTWLGALVRSIFFQEQRAMNWYRQ